LRTVLLSGFNFLSSVGGRRKEDIFWGWDVKAGRKTTFQIDLNNCMPFRIGGEKIVWGLGLRTLLLSLGGGRGEEQKKKTGASLHGAKKDYGANSVNAIIKHGYYVEQS